jgi:hypothetical protein
MNYGVEIGSRAMMYITKFHIHWFSHSKADSVGYTDIQTVWRSHKPTFIF